MSIVLTILLVENKCLDFPFYVITLRSRIERIITLTVQTQIFFFFYSSMVSTGTLDDIKFEILTNLHWNWNSVHRISFFLLGLDEVDPLLQRVHYLLILSSFA